MSIMLCTKVTLVKKNSCLFTRIISFGTAVLYLVTFCIPSHTHPNILHLISFTYSYINGVIIVLSNQVSFESMLPSFPAAKI